MGSRGGRSRGWPECASGPWTKSPSKGLFSSPLSAYRSSMAPVNGFKVAPSNSDVQELREAVEAKRLQAELVQLKRALGQSVHESYRESWGDWVDPRDSFRDDLFHNHPFAPSARIGDRSGGKNFPV